MSEAGVSERTVIEAMAEAPIVLPDDPAFLTADYRRDGEDLVIATADGGGAVISGYFALEAPADLMISGAAVAGRVVAALARPAAEAEDRPEPAPAEAEASAANAAESGSITLGEPIGAVGEIEGEAFAKRADGERVALRQGDPVFEGDVLSTSAGSSLGVAFTDGMTFSLGAEARMVLDEFRYDEAAHEGGGLFSVLAGQFSFVSGAAAHTAEDALMIETPTMTIGVRGTKVVSQIGADGETSRIALLAEEDGTVGKIMVMTDAGEELIAEPNKMVEISSRFEPPSPQKDIASADVLRFFSDALESLPAPHAFFEPKAAAPNPAPASPFAASVQAQSEAKAEAARADAAVQNAEAATSIQERLDEATEAAEEETADPVSASFTTVAERLEALVVETAIEDADGFADALLEQLEQTVEAREAAQEVVDHVREAAKEAQETLAEIIREEVATRLAEQEAAEEAAEEETQEETPVEEDAPEDVVVDENAAPALDASGAPSLPDAIEDGAAQTISVADLVPDGSIADADGAAVEAIAVTGVGAGGLWAYSTDGTTYHALSGVSDAAAVLLDAAATLRFTPTADFNGTSTLTYRAWDQSTGASGDTGVDASVNGGTTAFSAAVEVASITVAAENDAPALDTSGAPSLPGATEDGAAQVMTVADLVPDRSITDVDGAAVEAIAVTGLGAGGTWAYSTDGTSFTDFLGVSDTAAVLLAADAVLRFTPKLDFNGTSTLTYRAWDQSTGANGDTGVDVSTNGGTTAFSADAETAYVTVTAVNDAPTLDVAREPSLPTATEDGGAQTVTVASMTPDGSITDVDGAVEAIAVTGLGAGGTWAYSTDGTTYTDFPAVSDSAAVLLDATALLRFTPTGDFNGTSTITYRAWDKSTGANGDTGVDVSVNGGTTAFSAESDTGALTVAPVNDAPVLTDLGAQTAWGNEDTPLTMSVDGLVQAGAISDVDGAVEAIALTGLGGGGSWAYSTDGATYHALGAVSDSAAVLLDSTAFLRFTPTQDSTASSSVTFRAWDKSTGANGDTGVDITATGGTTAFSEATDSVAISLFAQNDAPVLDAAVSHAMTGVTSDGAAPASQTVASILTDGAISDVDGAAYEGIAITAVDDANGVWEYSTDGGSTFSAVAPVGTDGALLLLPTNHLRFTPTADYAGSSSITFRAWDASSGDGGLKVDTTTHGGTSAFSTATDTVSLAVTAPVPPNTAPVLDQAGAFAFDGSNDYITMGDPGASSDQLDIKTGDYTVEAWFYYDGTNASDVFVSKGEVLNLTDGFTIGRYNDTLYIMLQPDASDLSNVAATEVSLTKVGWNHVAMVIDQESGSDASTVTGYLNGSNAGWSPGYGLIADDAFTAPSGGIDSGRDLIIGAAQPLLGGTTAHANTQISDVRVWDTARTQTEIQSTMSTALDGTESGLVAHWPLDKDAVSDDVFDSVSGLEAVLKNGPTFVDPTSLTVAAGGTITGRLTAADADGDALTETLDTTASGATSFDADTGVWTYTADPGDVGTVTFTYQASDGNGGTSSLNFDVVVT